MEEKLKKELLKCKTQEQFNEALKRFCMTCGEDYIVLDKVFGDTQKAWRGRLIAVLKAFIDNNTLRPTRDITFSNDYSKFRISDITEPKKFNMKYLKPKEDE
jgi:hypothetical protein